MKIISPLTQLSETLRDLRKVKVAPGLRTVTFITYYRDKELKTGDYVGRVYSFNWTRLELQAVNVAHTNPEPPLPEKEEVSDEEEESHPAPLPAFGFSRLMSLRT